MEQPDIKKHNS